MAEERADLKRATGAKPSLGDSARVCAHIVPGFLEHKGVSSSSWFFTKYIRSPKGFHYIDLSV